MAHDVDDTLLNFTDNTTLFDIALHSGWVNFTPTNEQVGLHLVNVTVSDPAGLKCQTHFKVTVQNTNDPPRITTLDVLTATEDIEYSVQYNFTDPDIGETGFKWSLLTNGTWLSMDQTTGILHGTPRNKDVGRYFVNVTVTDPFLATDSHNFTLTVLNTNDPPIWTNVPKDTKMNDTETYSFDLKGTDEDIGDTLSYGKTSNPSTNMTLDRPTGRLKWVPGPNSAGDYTFNVSVTDGTVTIYHVFRIQVVHIIIDLPPKAILVSPADGVVLDVPMTTFNWTVSDPEGGAVTSDLFYGTSRDCVANAEASCRMAQGLTSTTFTTTGQLETGKTYYWTVVPHDLKQKGVSTNGIWSFKVASDAYINHPPTLTPVPSQQATAGKKFTVTVSGTDQDPQDSARLTYALQNPPTGMAIDPATGVITWTPTKDQVGEHKITVTLSDSRFSAQTSFTIQVKKAANPQNGFGSMLLPILIIVVVLVACVAVGLALWSRRRGKGKVPAPGPVAQQPPPAAATPPVQYQQQYTTQGPGTAPGQPQQEPIQQEQAWPNPDQNQFQGPAGGGEASTVRPPQPPTY
jgi:hypothetical protein